jgi:hypothetical protein
VTSLYQETMFIVIGLHRSSNTLVCRLADHKGRILYVAAHKLIKINT